MKRLVGLPGERIALRDGRLLIGEAIWPEPYLAVECREPAREWLLSDRAYLLLGDNRFDSRDSRDFGPVRRELIIGPAWFRYWPPGRRERLRGPLRPS